MKKIILTVVCATVLSMGSFNAFAHSSLPMKNFPPHHEMKGPKDFAKELNLTEEQKIQADKVREAGREKMKPLMQEKKALHDRMENVRKENMAEFEKILTPEQKEKFEIIKKNHVKRKFGHKHGNKILKK